MSESLRNVRTLSSLRTADDIRRVGDVKTQCTLSGIEANSPVQLDERSLAVDLWRDRQRLDKQAAAVQASRSRLLAMRSRLKAIKERNVRIQEQRRQIIRRRKRQEAAAVITTQGPAPAAMPPGGKAPATPAAGTGAQPMGRADRSTTLVIKY